MIYRCDFCGGLGWTIDRFSYRDIQCFVCRGEGNYKVKDGKIIPSKRKMKSE